MRSVFFRTQTANKPVHLSKIQDHEEEWQFHPRPLMGGFETACAAPVAPLRDYLLAGAPVFNLVRQIRTPPNCQPTKQTGSGLPPILPLDYGRPCGTMGERSAKQRKGGLNELMNEQERWANFYLLTSAAKPFWEIPSQEKNRGGGRCDRTPSAPLWTAMPRSGVRAIPTGTVRPETR